MMNRTLRFSRAHSVIGAAPLSYAGIGALCLMCACGSATDNSGESHGAGGPSAGAPGVSGGADAVGGAAPMLGESGTGSGLAAGQAGGSSGAGGVGAPAGGAAATAGTSGSDAGGAAGSSGAGGSSGASANACRPKFASGVNVAWFNFASDVPSPDLTKFNALFANIVPVGGRVVRWWLHTNGTVTPGYDDQGLAKPISQANLDDIASVIDAAEAAGVSINLSLWSFDMLQPSAGSMLTNNTQLLTVDANRQAYIDNVLTPLATRLKGHAGLYSWEIFNEPEGMTTENGWVPVANRIAEADVQKTVNWFADAIHQVDSSAQVTNGSWTFIANSQVNGYQNAYSDAALQAAGGRAKGTLDFYEVHYYDNWGSNNSVVSPFLNAAAHWNLDKPIVIGEFWALDESAIPNDATPNPAANDLFTTLYANGYAGGWAWQYANTDGTSSGTVDGSWPHMQQPMQNLYTAHPADLECQ
jgi:hypothetical protein